VVLAGTPVGNPADASPRLRELIERADIIAAEDTRRFRRLAADLGVVYSASVVSFYEAVEREKAAELAAAAQDGALVVLLTDAGMPSISDPGYRLVVACNEIGVEVSVVPGPSAVTAALAVSGLPSDRFCFEGFPPRKPGERARKLAELAAEPRTMVFFEAPHRLGASLTAMAEAFTSDRIAVVCRELTKTYEEVCHGTLGELAAWADEGVRGEVTVVVAGAPPEIINLSPAELNDRVTALVTAGLDKKAAIAQVAREVGLPKREVYDAVLAGSRTP
jgi:16S rRNA (cytidine1402-2'-O)-methyltransferase